MWRPADVTDIVAEYRECEIPYNGGLRPERVLWGDMGHPSGLFVPSFTMIMAYFSAILSALENLSYNEYHYPWPNPQGLLSAGCSESAYTHSPIENGHDSGRLHDEISCVPGRVSSSARPGHSSCAGGLQERPASMPSSVTFMICREDARDAFNCDKFVMDSAEVDVPSCGTDKDSALGVKSS